jgi:molybdate transport system substrate-binding protein
VWRPLLVSGLLFSACAKHGDEARGEVRSEVMVAAAASLRGVLPEIALRYERSHPGQKVTMTFGASGELRQEVVGGAPVDVVVFAGASPVDDLVGHGLVEAPSRAVLATNALVLIGPRDGKRKLSFATLTSVPMEEKVAIGDPRSVPAGQYAETALENLHEWDALKGRLVYGSDVSAVLAYARRREVAAAIVYKTELHGITDVEVLDQLGEGLAPRPEVVAGLVKGSRVHAAAAGFLGYLEGPEGRDALVKYGFGAP